MERRRIRTLVRIRRLPQTLIGQHFQAGLPRYRPGSHSVVIACHPGCRRMVTAGGLTPIVSKGPTEGDWAMCRQARPLVGPQGVISSGTATAPLLCPLRLHRRESSDLYVRLLFSRASICTDARGATRANRSQLQRYRASALLSYCAACCRTQEAARLERLQSRGQDRRCGGIVVAELPALLTMLPD